MEDWVIKALAVSSIGFIAMTATLIYAVAKHIL